ncbi:ATP-binding protein [Mesosutterella sp. AGMB02718]|uniref:histidine kinase n=1 Tax=Mesosutterella faecium TaxID=2925194 RepID=A0ABT7INA4_9BURK|nr:ATP-binding protein [Mesosutterella sp. AGMB02718]MDL2058806.1 ATP-binding protein [Mesosutterella sp. AGMB02718]
MTIFWTKRYRALLVLVPVVVCSLVVVLAMASSNSDLLDRYFRPLMILNVIVAGALVAVTIWMFTNLFWQWRRHRFGSQMTTRLALQIAAIAILPCLLLFAISSRFIGRSIDSWFNVRVETALDSGVNLSRAAVSGFQKQTSERAALLGDALMDIPQIEWEESLPRLKDRYGLSNVLIVSSRGEILTTSLSDSSQKIQVPSSETLSVADAKGVYSSLLENPGEPSGDQDIQVLAAAPITDRDFPSSFEWGGELGLTPGQHEGDFKNLRKTAYFLVTQEPLPQELATNIGSVTNGYRDYQELVLSRQGLRKLFTLSLTVSLLLAALGALVAAIAFTQIMMEPLRQLARGTRKVAGGNLSPIQEFAGHNEINVLTQSFNNMIGQLAEAQKKVLARTEELEQTGHFLQSVLSNLSSGVVVVDSGLHVLTANEGAVKILGPEVARAGISLEETAPKIASFLKEPSLELTHPLDENTSRRREIEIDRIGSQTPMTLFVRASRLHLSGYPKPGFVLVIDDMTQVISGQRAIAWGEVARRLAHEIKNPLTPIQLAAERLEMKLAGKLTEKDSQLLSRSVSTIVTQVSAMKQMVDDFRNYAKLPPAVLQPTDLNQLVEEVVNLYTQAGKPVSSRLEENLPCILADEAQLRQVFHNLISNSLDAMSGKPDGKVVIATESIHDGGQPVAVLLSVTDNGTGFSPAILHKSFEPYVTTKATGTGLGLPMVKKIVDEHKAEIKIRNLQNDRGEVLGAQVSIIFRAGTA